MRTRGREEGFVLLATLWILAGLAILAAYVDRVVASDLRYTIAARESVQAELDRRSTEVTLRYLLATGRMNHRGLILESEQRFSGSLDEDDHLPDHGDGELRVTEVVYAGVGGARFSIQDEGGLVSVNAPRSPLFASVLEHAGVSPSDVERIVARVEDYIDSDDTLTLNGAEYQEYRERGEPPPLNWIMASPVELTKVLGIDTLITVSQWERLLPMLTVRPAVGYNFNTMRPEILAALLDLDESGVQGVLEERDKAALSRLGQIAMLSGKHLDLDELEVRVLPSRFLRITVWHDHGGPRIVIGLAVTPLGGRAPWRTEYRYLMPTSADDGSDTPREFPLQAATGLLQ